MSGIEMGIYVPLPGKWAQLALHNARGADQRLWFVLYMTQTIACAIFSSPLYLGDAFIRGAYISFSGEARRGCEHFKQQGVKTFLAFVCAMFGFFLLLKGLIAGASNAHPNILIQDPPIQDPPPPPTSAPQPLARVDMPLPPLSEEILLRWIVSNIEDLRVDQFRTLIQQERWSEMGWQQELESSSIDTLLRLAAQVFVFVSRENGVVGEVQGLPESYYDAIQGLLDEHYPLLLQQKIELDTERFRGIYLDRFSRQASGLEEFMEKHQCPEGVSNENERFKVAWDHLCSNFRRGFFSSAEGLKHGIERALNKIEALNGRGEGVQQKLSAAADVSENILKSCLSRMNEIKDTIAESTSLQVKLAKDHSCEPSHGPIGPEEILGISNESGYVGKLKEIEAWRKDRERCLEELGAMKSVAEKWLKLRLYFDQGSSTWYDDVVGLFGPNPTNS